MYCCFWPWMYAMDWHFRTQWSFLNDWRQNFGDGSLSFDNRLNMLRSVFELTYEEQQA